MLIVHSCLLVYVCMRAGEFKSLKFYVHAAGGKCFEFKINPPIHVSIFTCKFKYSVYVQSWSNCKGGNELSSISLPCPLYLNVTCKFSNILQNQPLSTTFFCLW